MTKTDAIFIVKVNYGNHPCGTKFCRCGWIFCPPAYPTDYWDCMNPECAKSKAPSANDTKRMLNPKRQRS